MEFRYRAGERREPPPPPPPHPLLQPMAAALRREMLKQQIREEILAREAAERREIEEEVRHELDMERAMPVFLMPGPGLRVHPSSTISDSPLSEITQVNQSQPSLARIKRKGGAVAGSNKVARPGIKRKGGAVAGSNKVALPGEPTKVAPACERNLHCALCEVSTTSEEGMKDHLNGKKHQANVASLSSKGSKGVKEHLKKKKHEVTGTTVSSAFVSVRKSVSSSDSTPEVSATSLQEDADRETKKLTMIVNGKRHEVVKKDKLFWCVLCSVKCNCTELMAAHLEGKKHRAREGESNAHKFGKTVATNAEAVNDVPTTERIEE